MFNSFVVGWKITKIKNFRYLIHFRPSFRHPSLSAINISSCEWRMLSAKTLKFGYFNKPITVFDNLTVMFKPPYCFTPLGVNYHFDDKSGSKGFL